MYNPSYLQYKYMMSMNAISNAEKYLTMDHTDDRSTTLSPSNNDTDYDALPNRRETMNSTDGNSNYQESLVGDEENKIEFKTINKRISKSNRNKRREEARIRQKLKQEANAPELTSNSGACSADEKNNKKLQQKIRNRISAQLSRDRKKQHISQLEQKVSNLEEENSFLRDENKKLNDRNSYLEQRLAELEARNLQLDSGHWSRTENIFEDTFHDYQLRGGYGYLSPLNSINMLGFISVCLILGVCFISSGSNSFSKISPSVNIVTNHTFIPGKIIKEQKQNKLLSAYSKVKEMLETKLKYISYIALKDMKAKLIQPTISALATIGSELMPTTWEQAKTSKFQNKDIYQSASPVANLPVAYKPDFKIRTLYCGKTYIHDNENELVYNNNTHYLGQELKSSDKIQMFLSPSDLHSFSMKGEDLNTKKIPAPKDNNILIELVCEVKAIHSNLGVNPGQNYVF